MYVSQAETVWLEDVLLLIVNTNILVSEQPAAFVPTKVYVPLSVYVCPFTDQVYVSHAVAESLEDVLAFIVNTNVFVSVQPAALVPTKV